MYTFAHVILCFTQVKPRFPISHYEQRTWTSLPQRVDVATVLGFDVSSLDLSAPRLSLKISVIQVKIDECLVTTAFPHHSTISIQHLHARYV